RINGSDNFLEEKRVESGIQKLRIKYSTNFGYCLEVSKAQMANVPESWMRKQTLVNAERFTTPELAEYEDKVLNAEAKAFELEHKLFQDLRNEVLTYIEKIQDVAEKIGILDALLSLANTAHQYRWHRPKVSDKNTTFEIKKGRHPVVEKISTEPFIANDLRMDEDGKFWLITGPNMAGKSTYLRQNALIILLAQIGSFVPAESCTMPVFDRIFTRVGASDNLAGGQSTFFVEMSETARILNAATDKSFVILDEIGRGTSTFDGISLAWAITEYLHDKIGARTIFATHYHELIDCVENLKSGKNYHVSVTNDEDQMIFLRKIKPGGISDSFGIEVAAMCGFPPNVLTKAKDILHQLENENLAPAQPSLFMIPQESAQEMKKELSEIEEKTSRPRSEGIESEGRVGFVVGVEAVAGLMSCSF
ncbi:DNA mismatch repair protein MutS, partial [Candidatus Gracilibacteria bacterium]|nr:DNA mismatch repair protein MutS [Candidatus Gracilibacteria bacterium]